MKSDLDAPYRNHFHSLDGATVETCYRAGFHINWIFMIRGYSAGDTDTVLADEARGSSAAEANYDFRASRYSASAGPLSTRLQAE